MADSVILSGRFFGSSHKWLAGRGLVTTLTANTLEEVCPLIDKVEGLAENGHTCIGFISYEAAAAFDSKLDVHPGGHLPYAWFQCYEGVEPVEAIFPELPCTSWIPSCSKAEYKRAIAAIKQLLASGDTYQVNHTFRLRAKGIKAEELMGALTSRQPDSYGAFIETEDFAICSVSPELYLNVDGENLAMQPMKGTRPRAADDAAQLEELEKSTKDRAENLMIVDMTRNDLGKIAQFGSVRVTDLFETETHPTVHQMTSKVHAKSDASLRRILSAVFPAASITGAPKVRTMEIIRQLEPDPRGLYTGCIGVWGPGRKGSFSVGIRTASIDKRANRAEYGIGSGIVWDSDAEAEWKESHLKASILYPDYDLLETIRFEPDEGFLLLDRHMERMSRSADALGFDFNRAAVQSELSSLSKTEPCKIRLMLSRGGSIAIETAALTALPSAMKLGAAHHAVRSDDPALKHKTTDRQLYIDAISAHPDADEVILTNEHDEVTEACNYNLIAKIEGRWVTPPLSCGLLPGTMREELLSSGEIAEQIITYDALRTADQIQLINSVRGRIDAVIQVKVG
jgi:para-aminobenzoate synthetase/4-amino-4-deoxychorismate lyase